MLIYAVADIHGKPERLSLIRKKINDTAPDVLVVAGDITGYIRPVPTIEALNNMPVPVIAVRGNTDMPVVEKLFKKYTNISHAHLNKILIKNRWFTGMSGTVPVPFRSRIRLMEKKVLKKAGALLDKRSILIAHPPPWGILDHVFGRFHAGSMGLLKLLKETEPALCICGHIHEAPGSEVFRKTLVVNCSIGRGGAGSLIELREDGTVNVTGIGR
ncbi:MAG: metallophosphoesterase family protein [Deltaproteobacteria bacterium]|nr:metallophosphoesterase family protein [Deltaproteobacteria bacterium]